MEEQTVSFTLSGMLKFGDALKMIRNQKKLYQKDLAELSGISRTTIMEFEKSAGGRITNYLKLLDAMDAEVTITIKKKIENESESTNTTA